VKRVRIVSGLLGGVLALSTLTAATAAGASGISIKVSPTSGLANGQTVKVAGKGLPLTTKGKPNSFFLDQCTAAVAGKLTVADESHCDISLAKALKVSKSGAFATTFKVATGTIGDGTCSATAPCVIGVGDITGQGAVAKITFR
jgi:hypothetical protein